jgi:hypothetical protein
MVGHKAVMSDVYQAAILSPGEREREGNLGLRMGTEGKGFCSKLPTVVLHKTIPCGPM